MIMVTGGLGFLGSHTCVELLRTGHAVLILDNMSNSRLSVLERIREVGGSNFRFLEVDMRDRASLAAAFASAPVEAVVHFAGLKAVGESVRRPLAYYDNNVAGSVCLLEAMAAAGVRRMVFSSSATVYGQPVRLPYTEDHPLAPESPYGRSKAQVEALIADIAAADPGFRHATLRYFNPVGAHPSGRLGEDPLGAPNNLFPFITRVAAGRLARLTVHGSDYDTPDGTGVRDYIHVMDLASAHLAAVRRLLGGGDSIVANVGSGHGHSVLEVLAAFERTTGAAIPREFGPRRAGDISSYHADPSRAAAQLGWTARRGLEDMCRDAWAWQQGNPDGYPL
jgi:UDP-glucose 4-epimerase